MEDDKWKRGKTATFEATKSKFIKICKSQKWLEWMVLVCVRASSVYDKWDGWLCTILLMLFQSTSFGRYFMIDSYWRRHSDVKWFRKSHTFCVFFFFLFYTRFAFCKNAIPLLSQILINWNWIESAMNFWRMSAVMLPVPLIDTHIHQSVLFCFPLISQSHDIVLSFIKHFYRKLNVALDNFIKITIHFTLWSMAFYNLVFGLGYAPTTKMQWIYVGVLVLVTIKRGNNFSFTLEKSWQQPFTWSKSNLSH